MLQSLLKFLRTPFLQNTSRQHCFHIYEIDFKSTEEHLRATASVVDQKRWGQLAILQKLKEINDRYSGKLLLENELKDLNYLS